MKPKHLDLITKWSQTLDNLNAHYGALQELTGASPEAKLPKAIFEAFSDYTAVLSIHLGDDDNFLEWYAWENDNGAKGLKACPGFAQSHRVIDTIEKLAQIIESARSDSCRWTWQESDCFWQGTCGAAWQLEADDPEANNMKFCPECGKPLTQTKTTP